MKYIISFFTFLYFLVSSVSANDTIRVMQYNLLYYDMITSFCTESNNNVNQKNIYLNTIVNHFKPDIFTVNELNGSPSSVDLLLNGALNINGVTRYRNASFTGSYLINMLYYNSEKLALKRQSHIQTSPRQTDVYTLYLVDDNLALGDTTYLTCIVTHLKAGSTVADQNERALAAKQIMNYIVNRKLDGNIMMMGDFNVYTHTEEAFQRLLTTTTTGVQLHDPANAVGNWHDNSSFSPYHTQSTHTSGSCFSGGGMDDRFDFILASTPLIEGARGAKYIEDSYWAYGQDGNRLNGSLISPTNNSLPANIISALYNMSDHLPVTLKIHMDHELYLSDGLSDFYAPTIKVINPVSNTIDFYIDGITPQNLKMSVYSSIGLLMQSRTLSVNEGERYSVPADLLIPGAYFVVFSGNDFQKTVIVIKQ